MNIFFSMGGYVLNVNHGRSNQTKTLSPPLKQIQDGTCVANAFRRARRVLLGAES